MRTLRTIGIVGSGMALLLSATVAFAKDEGTGLSGDSGVQVGMMTNAAEQMQAIRAQVQTRMMGQSEKLGERMMDIKDKVKQGIATSLATRFDNLNATWTDRFMQTLDKYDAVLVKIQARAAIASSAGKDITATNAAVQSATTAITNARTAVLAQAAKTYVIDPTTIFTTSTTTDSGQEKLMEKMRTSFKSLNTTLFSDLFALRDGPMKAARKAVGDALQTLKDVPGVDEDSATSTESGNR